MKAAVIVDSTAYLSEALAQHPDVYQVALSVNFSDGSVMKDGTQTGVGQDEVVQQTLNSRMVKN